MSRDFMNDIYRDFFGGENGKDSGSGARTPRFDPQTGEPLIPEGEGAEGLSEFLKRQEEILSQLEKVEGTAAASTEEALRHANEAILEAQALFGGRTPGMTAPEKEEQAAGTEACAQEKKEEKEKEEEEDPMEQLNGLIGLDSIKKDVADLVDFVKVQKLRREKGLKSVPVSLHLVFTGNPGTGKTTVARIIARLYKKIGVLSSGQLVETDRSGLVAGYVGQTALKTTEQIGKAMGGVLFIDEAYSLSKKDDAFGEEAIDTLLKAMEDRRDEFVVIVAGYTNPMKKFIESNPGLKSRFNKYIEFPDYTVDELMAIFEMNCRKYDYTAEEDALKHVRELITLKKMEQRENFANAREVRNLFEKVITKQAGRVALLPEPTPEDMSLITMEDIEVTDDMQVNEELIESLKEKEGQS